MTTEAMAAAMNRIADALEQLVLAGVPADPYPKHIAPTDEFEELGPVKVVEVCPIHKTPWKTVPAGVSKKTGKAYSAFRACSTAGCDQRPA